MDVWLAEHRQTMRDNAPFHYLDKKKFKKIYAKERKRIEKEKKLNESTVQSNFGQLLMM